MWLVRARPPRPYTLPEFNTLPDQYRRNHCNIRDSEAVLASLFHIQCEQAFLTPALANAYSFMRRSLLLLRHSFRGAAPSPKYTGVLDQNMDNAHVYVCLR